MTGLRLFRKKTIEEPKRSFEQRTLPVSEKRERSEAFKTTFISRSAPPSKRDIINPFISECNRQEQPENWNSQITGLPADYDGKIKLRSIRWNYGSSGNNPIWQNHDWTFVPESSAEGLFFWTYWNTSNDWDDNDCQTSIFNLIPEEHSINAWHYQGTQEYEIWIEGEGAYFDTGIRFRMGIY